MKIYCINLDSRPDRWGRMKKRFEELGFDNVERFSAVTPDDPEVQNIGHFGSRKEKACALSHYRVWKLAQERGETHILVLEDDVRFHKNFKIILEDKVQKLLNQDKLWDCLSLNYVSLNINWTTGWEQMRSQTLAGGYLLSPKGLNFLTHNFGSIILPSDHMIRCLYLQGHSYGHFPWLCVQEYEDSDIQSPEHFQFMAEWFKNKYFPQFGELYKN